MNTILKSHCIEPKFLRDDDFDGFYENRRAALLGLVEQAMGMTAVPGGNGNGYKIGESEDEDQ